MDELEMDLIDVTLWICRPIDGGVDVLRQFSADVQYEGTSQGVDIGQVHGWIGWSIADENVADAGDAICYDAMQLGTAAQEIIDGHLDTYIDSALLIDRMHLHPEWRGRRMSGLIISRVLDLLRLTPGETAVVLHPEPQQPTGGPYVDGPERDDAMSRLHAAYRASGLTPWRDGPVWWRPI
ncbi:hypothetical protein [Nocardioides okcheonensis]|uniref:hypothetical protein n=1 Tax=Nocardioides okcheonensis TaxID=2894081 RepID=UPI001E4AD8EF|nr:hypothetical protein [Nocardioides okcheonensis]UFN45185.1 hypothetical protein LN652_02935 [Nocardioides okcheonensis]